VFVISKYLSLHVILISLIIKDNITEKYIKLDSKLLALFTYNRNLQSHLIEFASLVYDTTHFEVVFIICTSVCLKGLSTFTSSLQMLLFQYNLTLR